MRGITRAAQLPVCPPHQHIVKHLDLAAYFNGPRETDARNGACGSVCVMGKGKSSGDPSARTPVYASLSLSFSREKKRESGGERGEGVGAREIILFWNLDSGAHRPRSQSIWPV